MFSKIKVDTITAGIGKLYWTIPILAIILYSNTIAHDYTQDDAIVIYNNMFTTQGIQGVPGLLKYDTFRGFFKTEGKSKLVSGGRYRPLTPVMFAIEYEIFGKNPMVGHIINVLLYAFLGLVVFWTLRQMLVPIWSYETASWLALITALFYVAHPIHTEVVANIKGRDEIVAMLASVSTLWLALKYIPNPRVVVLFGVFVCFLIGLFSKENTITYLAILPLVGVLFKKSQIKKLMFPFGAMILATIVFLIVRTSVLGFDMGGTPTELMNNPFLKWDGENYLPFTYTEKMATIVYTLGKYLCLLIFPHPLTHDYYPRHIEMMNWGNMSVIASIGFYLTTACVIVYYRKSRPVVSFCGAYFLITLSIVSNIVFPIGTNMSERFLFMPSLGYSLLLSWFITYQLRRWIGKKGVLILTCLILCLYSIKTISRNTVWKNDFTLFTTDVKTSKRSAKVLNAAGGALTTEAYKLPEGSEKTSMLREAIGYLNRALEIHPRYKNAALLLGNAHYYLDDTEKAIEAYRLALDIAPNYDEARKNLAIVLREVGKKAGEQEQNLEKALLFLKQSYQLDADVIETVRLLGVASGIAGNHIDAIFYFEKVVEKAPSKESYKNLGTAYMNYGDKIKATEYYNQSNSFAE